MGDTGWRRALLDAEAWRVRLDDSSVSIARLREFRQWRQDPLHELAWRALAAEAARRARAIS